MGQRKQALSGKVLRKASALLLVGSLSISMVAACSKGDGQTSNETRVLRIGTMYGSNEDTWFRQQYTDAFELINQGNIEIQIVPAVDYSNQRFNSNGTSEEEQKDPYVLLTELLTGQNPVDVVVVEYSYLRRLVQDNLLKQLDPLITQDKFDIEDYVPTVIDGIKEAGDGSIYALTPTFSSSALFYNKKIFTDAGINPPADGMSWDEAFTLARQIAKGEGQERVYGFAFNRWSDGYWDTQTLAAPLQLKIHDDKAEKMLVNSPQWEKIWTTVAGLYLDKITPNMNEINNNNNGEMMDEPRVYNPWSHDLFMSGKLAMTIADYNYVTELKQASEQIANNDEIDMEPVEWDVVTVPEHPEVPGIGGNVYLSTLMGVSANAQNPDDAWNFVKFLNSKEYAKLKSRSMYEMTARKEFLKPIDGVGEYNLPAFYSMKPVPPQNNFELDQIYRKYPNYWMVTNIGPQLFQEVLQETKTVQEALAAWETQGDAMLKEMRENPGGMIDGGPIPMDTYTQEELLKKASGEISIDSSEAEGVEVNETAAE